MPHCEVVQNTQPYIYDEGSTSCFHSPTFLYCIIFFVLMLLYNGGSQASRKWHLMGSVCWRFSTRGGVPMDPSLPYQNYMDDLSQMFLVLGQFVTLLFWTICHKSYLS